MTAGTIASTIMTTTTENGSLPHDDNLNNDAKSTAAIMKYTSSSTSSSEHVYASPLSNGQPSSYRSSLFRSCCTVQNFCYLVQVINCALLGALLAISLQEYPKIEALEKQVEEDKDEIATLEEEVREKQEGQIQELHQQVANEQQFNALSLAGIFTLLTCLISIFHMSMHLQKMNQPQIQRKIIAILWMSPIYSVTSFLTLLVPSLAGWMAIIKDFYEAYCIYTFLSFLISVLGHGSRDQAVEVLTRHASNLQRPTKCLECFYEPPPELNDHAKANAVITECQIFCLQFTFLRPITTVIYVLMKGGEGSDDSSTSESFSQDGSSSGDDETWPTATTISSFPPSPSLWPTSFTDGNNEGNSTGTRSLRQKTLKRKGQHRQLQDEGQATSASSNNNSTSSTNGIDSDTTNNPDDAVNSPDDVTFVPSPSPIEGSFSATVAPSIVSNVINSFAPVMAGVAGTFVPTTSGNIDTSEGSTSFPVSAPSMIPTPSLEVSDDLYESTVEYFKSPGFALAMVVNVSVFIAFTGLLKFYHAVHDDLKWCRPWPKFLTIKGVVFVTFWQGLMISIFVVVLADPSDSADAPSRASKYQNILICMEMLFFAIVQWVSWQIKKQHLCDSYSSPCFLIFVYLHGPFWILF
jgi:hypothetical protein